MSSLERGQLAGVSPGDGGVIEGGEQSAQVNPGGSEFDTGVPQPGRGGSAPLGIHHFSCRGEKL